MYSPDHSQTWHAGDISGTATVHNGNIVQGDVNHNTYHCPLPEMHMPLVVLQQEDPEKRRQEKEEREDFLRRLFWTDPGTGLAVAVDRSRAGRTPGTCEWILHTEQYVHWHESCEAQLLFIVGEPGIGKTMMSTFLVERLAEEGKSEQGTITYFFCNNTAARQRDAVSIVRGMLWHMIQAQSSIPTEVLESFKCKGTALFESIEDIWPCFQRTFSSSGIRNVTILLDALDECDEASREKLVPRLASLLTQSNSVGTGKRRIIITSRDIPTVADLRSRMTVPPGVIRMDTARINADLRSFIKSEVRSISMSWDDQLRSRVVHWLRHREGGTFL